MNKPPRTGGASSPEERKRRAKVHNERIKMRANAFNALGVALVAAAFVFPVIRDGNPSALLEWRTWIWVFAGVGLHFVGSAYLDGMRSED